MEENFENLPSLLTVKEMAEILSLKPQKAYQLINMGRIPVLRFRTGIIRVPTFGILPLIKNKEGING